MKKLLFTAAALGALAAAAPATSQSYPQGYQGNYPQGYANANGGVGMGNRIAQLDARLRAGVQSGAISREEAQNIRPQLRQLRDLERQYSANGLTQQERNILQQRLRSVRQQMRMADGGAMRNDQYGSWDDDQDSGWQDGRRNDGYAGQGGPYEEMDERCQQQRGGIGGIISSVLGRGNDCGGFQVGQRVSGNLYAVPYQYQNQFRDTGSVYYRSDGRQIYQIDARTNTVVRVYGMNR